MSARSNAEWAILDELRRHDYLTTRLAKADDPGMHPCSCGWIGYWSAWQPHVAKCIAEGVAVRNAT